jgi:hypothetical protein
MPFDQGGEMAVVRAREQITFPVPGYGTIFCRGRSLADGDGIRNLAKPLVFQAGMPGAPDRPLGAQVLLQLFFQYPAGLNE